MKKLSKIIMVLMVAVAIAMPYSALAKDKAKTVKAPALQSISFNNAEIEGEFSPVEFSYTLNVEDSKTTPTLKDYKVSKDAEIFVTYNDGLNGINVEVKNDSLSANYSFEYSNYQISSNNNLKALESELGCVYPELSEEKLDYDFYIPRDLTEIKPNAIPQDMTARCDVPHSIVMNDTQAPQFEVSVVASNGMAKVYTFNIKRLDMTCDEVEKALEEQDYSALIKGESFKSKPEFKIIIFGVLGGVIALAIAISLLKRIAVKAEDIDEIDFFESTVDEEE